MWPLVSVVVIKRIAFRRGELINTAPRQAQPTCFLSPAWRPLAQSGLQHYVDRQGGAWTLGIIGRFPWLTPLAHVAWSQVPVCGCALRRWQSI